MQYEALYPTPKTIRPTYNVTHAFQRHAATRVRIGALRQTLLHSRVDFVLEKLRGECTKSRSILVETFCI